MKRTSLSFVGLMAFALALVTGCSQGPKLKDAECHIQFLNTPEGQLNYAVGQPTPELIKWDTLTVNGTDCVVPMVAGNDALCLVRVPGQANTLMYFPQPGGVRFQEQSVGLQSDSVFTFMMVGDNLSDANRELNSYYESRAREVLVDLSVAGRTLRRLYQSMHSDPTNTAVQGEMEQLYSRYDELTQKDNELMMNFIKSSRTTAGAVIMANNLPQFYDDPEEAIRLLNNFPPSVFTNHLKGEFDKALLVSVGKKFTDFELPDPDGKPVRLSDVAGKGKPVLLDFWAGWCGPCRKTNPSLVELHNKYKGRGFTIFGVSLDADAEKWKAAIAEDKLEWTNVSALKMWDCPIRTMYMVFGIPHNLLLDGEGTIVAKNLHGEELDKKVEELLGGSRPAYTAPAEDDGDEEDDFAEDSSFDDGGDEDFDAE